MTSAPLVTRRAEMGIGIQELAARSNIVAGALKDAERRDSLEHFTVAQVRRLSSVLSVNLTDLLSDPASECSADRSVDAHGESSDEALALIIEIHEEEVGTGYWSEAANCDPPNAQTAELLKSGVLCVVNGIAVLDSQITEALAIVADLPAVEPTRNN